MASARTSSSALPHQSSMRRQHANPKDPPALNCQEHHLPPCTILLGQKSCRTKVPRIFRFFVLDFAPNFAPNFPRIFQRFFVLHFVGNGHQKKFTKNPRHFSMQNSRANTEKIFTKFFWRAGKVKVYNVQMHAAVLGDRLPEGTQTPLLGPGSPSLQCRH